MVRGGSSEPTCWMNLWSIGVFNAENNPKFASKLYPLISEKLGITDDRYVFIAYLVLLTFFLYQCLLS